MASRRTWPGCASWTQRRLGCRLTGAVRDGAGRALAALSLIAVLLLAACGFPAQEVALPVAGAGGSVVYVLGQGWHAGLIVGQRALQTPLWPERGDFPGAQFVEIGWGERDFYQADDPGPWLALQAALWSSSSVVYLAGLRNRPEDTYPCSDLIELRLPLRRLERLIRFIHDSFDRADGRRVPPLRPGGQYYPARGRFHLFNTCNTWTARALEAAGFPVDWPYPLTAAGLVAQARRWGRVVAPLPICHQH